MQTPIDKSVSPTRADLKESVNILEHQLRRLCANLCQEKGFGISSLSPSRLFQYFTGQADVQEFHTLTCDQLQEILQENSIGIKSSPSIFHQLMYQLGSMNGDTITLEQFAPWASPLSSSTQVFQFRF